jgi:hypothetical protein
MLGAPGRRSTFGTPRSLGWEGLLRVEKLTEDTGELPHGGSERVVTLLLDSEAPETVLEFFDGLNIFLDTDVVDMRLLELADRWRLTSRTETFSDDRAGEEDLARMLGRFAGLFSPPDPILSCVSGIPNMGPPSTVKAFSAFSSRLNACIS